MMRITNQSGRDLGRQSEMRYRNRIRSKTPLLRDPLPTEDEIMASWVSDGPIVVTVICATYNHGPLLEDALRSVLGQKTDFRFEIVVRDDASTDGTQEILRRYALDYPRLIRLVLNDVNLFELGRRPVYDFPDYIRGEFVAICQGDDFWTVDDKLQRQVDQLRRHPDCVVSMAASIVIDVVGESEAITGLAPCEETYEGMPTRYHHPSTYLVKSAPYIFIVRNFFIPNGLYGDTPLRRFLRDYGKFCLLPDVMSVYWCNQRGVWTGLTEKQRAREEFLNSGRIIRCAPFHLKRAELVAFIYNGARLFEGFEEPRSLRSLLSRLPYLPLVGVRGLARVASKVLAFLRSLAFVATL